MTPAVPGGGSRPRRRVDLVLAAAVLLAGCLVIVLAVAVVQQRSRPATALESAVADRYADVLAAATAEAEAFVNIRHDRAQESIDAVAAGATGEFRDQYAESTEGVLQVLRENRSVMEGEVVWSGVVDVDEDSATVLVATTGTVANKQTGDEPVARDFRLRLELVLEDGRWLTSDLQFVG